MCCAKLLQSCLTLCNGKDCSPPGSSVSWDSPGKHTGCQKINESVRVEIQDFGEGIPSDQIPYIWDRYYKIDRTHVRAQKGSGIGLNICKEILELHQSKYGVISKLNEGTIFWFELPCVTKQL